MTTTALFPLRTDQSSNRQADGTKGMDARRDREVSLRHEPKTKLLSFVIPVLDEEHSLNELRKRIAASVPADCEYEIIFVDDGSSDGSWAVIESMSRWHPDHVRGIRFRHNVGKAAGLTAGFRAAQGEVIFTLDADLQDDPREIPRFLNKLSEGYSLVSGWKKTRLDPWHKVLPSRIFNWMLSRITGVKLHDHNCGFKCYQRELAKDMTLHGEMHRMVPALASMSGFTVAEIEVHHQARLFGRSKYGFERFLRGFSDMVTMGFLRRFRERPAHFVNSVAFIYMVIALGAVAGGLASGLGTLGGAMALLTAVIFTGIAGAVVVVGLLSELCLRGGLQMGWQLPVVEDTVISGTPPSGDANERAIKTGYLA